MQLNSRFWILTALIITVALCRYFLISIPNAAPIAAIALFGGAYFADRKYALLVPLLALLLSDVMMEITFRMGMQPFVGFYPHIFVVYFSFALMVGMGMYLKGRRKPLLIAGSAIFAGLLFFLITNFSVWAIGTGSTYTKDLSGLILCYEAGIPFLKNTLISNLLFTGALFGGFELIKMRFPRLAAAQ